MVLDTACIPLPGEAVVLCGRDSCTCGWSWFLGILGNVLESLIACVVGTLGRSSIRHSLSSLRLTEHHLGLMEK